MNLMFGKSRRAVVEQDGGWILATGQPSPDVNCAFIASPSHADAKLFSYLRKFEKLRVPCLICMSPEAVEAAGPRAERFGMVSVGGLSLMTLSESDALDV